MRKKILCSFLAACLLLFACGMPTYATIYDGADVKRFTYYNADKPADGGSVFAEYENGLKIKETVYSNDLKVENSYTAEYHNGEREGITIWDKNNKEIQKLVPVETAQSL